MLFQITVLKNECFDEPHKKESTQERNDQQKVYKPTHRTKVAAATEATAALAL